MQSRLVSAPNSRMSDLIGAWLAPLLVGLGVYCVAVAGAHALLNDGDTLSHIAIGRWIIAHRAIPFYDPFSFTAHGRTWVPHEWLSEVIFAFIYGRFGWGGVIAATGLASAAAFALLTRALAQTLGARRAAIGAVAAFSLVEAHFLARPHVLAWPLSVVWMAGVIGARDRGRAPPLALLPVMILWCNLHGGFVVGLLLAAVLALEAMVQAPRGARYRTAAKWSPFLVLAGLSTLASPNGIDVLLLPFKMFRMNFALSSISEWRAADFARLDPLELWIALAILSGLALGIRLPLSRVLMLLLLLWMALTHVRNEELLGIIAPLLIAAPLAAQLSPPAGGVSPIRASRHRISSALLGIAALATLIVCGFFVTAWALDRGGLAPRQDVAPVAAVEAAGPAGFDGHVFNSVRFGGYLMFRGIPTFVDGRADLFGDAFLERYVTASNAVGGLLPVLLDEYAVTWTLLEPASPAVSLLDHLPGWKRVYADRYAVIHRRALPAS